MEKDIHFFDLLGQWLDDKLSAYGPPTCTLKQKWKRGVYAYSFCSSIIHPLCMTTLKVESETEN